MTSAGAMQIQEASEDEFRKQWTGHVLIPNVRTRNNLLVMPTAIGDAIALVAWVSARKAS